MQNLEAKIEGLNDHGMDLMVLKEAPKKMINLILQDQYQNLMERQFSVEDDFSNLIQWVDVEKIKKLCHLFAKTLNPYHTFFLYIFLELTFLDKTMLLLSKETNAQRLGLKLN